MHCFYFFVCFMALIDLIAYLDELHQTNSIETQLNLTRTHLLFLQYAACSAEYSTSIKVNRYTQTFTLTNRDPSSHQSADQSPCLAVLQPDTVRVVNLTMCTFSTRFLRRSERLPDHTQSTEWTGVTTISDLLYYHHHPRSRHSSELS